LQKRFGEAAGIRIADKAQTIRSQNETTTFNFRITIFPK